jgi:hypothetical protein
VHRLLAVLSTLHLVLLYEDGEYGVDNGVLHVQGFSITLLQVLQAPLLYVVRDRRAVGRVEAHSIERVVQKFGLLDGRSKGDASLELHSVRRKLLPPTAQQRVTHDRGRLQFQLLAALSDGALCGKETLGLVAQNTFVH